MRFPTHHVRQKKGFTLIETVLALGIIALVAIPAFTLMAIGSNLNRESQQSVFVSQIVDQVARDVGQTDFSDIPDNYPLIAFDSEGIRLREPTDPERLYVVQVSVFKTASLPGPESPSGNLARVIIDVVIDRSGSGSPAAELFATDGEGNLTAREASRQSLFVSRND